MERGQYCVWLKILGVGFLCTSIATFLVFGGRRLDLGGLYMRVSDTGNQPPGDTREHTHLHVGNNNATDNLLRSLGMLSEVANATFINGILKTAGTPPKHTTGVPKVLIVSHYRGGSSFVGQFFAQHPSIFYMFEPLHAADGVSIKLRTALKARQVSERELDIRARQGMGLVGRAMLRGITNCDFNYALSIVPNLLRDSSFIARDVKLTREVIRAHHCTHKTLSTGGSCVTKASDSCQGAKAIATKMIRIRLREVAGLVAEDPAIRVISYVRDPRGTIASRAGISKNMNISRAAADLCGFMKDDLAVEESVSRVFPDRIIRVRYEDLGRDPYKVGQSLYDTLKLGTMPGSVKAWIGSVTGPLYKSMSSKRSPYTTARNAANTIYQWRKTITQDMLQTIHKEPLCKEVFDKLGYEREVHV